MSEYRCGCIVSARCVWGCLWFFLFVWLCVFVCVFLFFWQKAAFELSVCLLGSEMFIRDSSVSVSVSVCLCVCVSLCLCCLFYTSDAADEEDSVDVGGAGFP